MASKRKLLAIVTLLGAILVCRPCIADTIVVRSGERLGGKVMRKSGDTLMFLTNYAGLIRIQWSKVVAISTDAPVTLQLDDGSAPFRARLDEDEPEHISVARVDEKAETEPDEISVEMIHVAYINPLPEETSKGVNYKGRATLSVTKTGGNTDVEAAYAEVSLTARARNYRYELGAKGNRGSAAGRTTNSSWLARGNYDRFLDTKHFAYGRASAERDAIRGIDQRDTAGVGYGVQLIDSPKTQFSIRGGIDYVTTHHLEHGTDSYPSLGWGIKLSHRLESYRTEVFHEQEGYWNVTNANQMSLRTRTGLRVPLMAGLTATAQANVDWERRPLPGRKTTNSLWLFGLGYEW